MTVENPRAPVIAGIGAATAWALYVLVHAPGWMIVASVALTAAMIIALRRWR